MLKNKAGWVAIIVLAIASLLMIFFVMPNIQQTGNKTVADVPPQATPAAAPDTTAAGDAKTARPTAADEAATKPAAPVEPAAPAAPSAPADTTTAQKMPEPAAPAANQPPVATAPDTASAAVVPGFDILRVEPDGSTVIAGRAQPGAKIEIVNGDAVMATAQADSIGDFAAVFDVPLPPGDYQLSLRGIGKDGAVTLSEETATVSVPKTAAGDLLAMVTKPGEASRIIAAPAAPTTTTTSPAASAQAPAAPSGTMPSATTPATTPTPTTAAASPMTKPAALAVSAVEIEGRKIFVAGNAAAGTLVRIYADDKLVGEAKADEHGRFVVDGAIDLAVGQHIIRADQTGPDGKTVQLRASVPFDRPAGEQIAAVAQPGTAGTVAPFDGGSFDDLRVEAGKALGLLKGLFNNGAMPGPEQLAAARSSTEIALNSMAEFKVADTLDSGVRDMVRKAAGAAGRALKLLKSLPQDAASIRDALPQIEAAVGSALMPRTDGAGAPAVAENVAPAQATQAQGTPSPSPATMPSAPSVAAAPNAATAPNASEAAKPASEPEIVQQAPLQQSKSSVIIRRGDTLWQISRRVYGAGVRYTTIYVANEDQITDPNRILPGQVFGVPDTAMPDAQSEEIHRKHLPRKP